MRDFAALGSDDEDLQFLEKLSSVPPTGTIWRRTLAGAAVKFSGPSGTLETLADVKGAYRFENLAPGKYGLGAIKEGYHLWPAYSTAAYLLERAVEARGWGMVDIHLVRSWPGAISGSVALADGAPSPEDIRVDLVSLDANLPDTHTATDAQGEYRFQYVAPGKYKVALGFYSFPTPKAPYPAQYWPGTIGDAKSAGHPA